MAKRTVKWLKAVRTPGRYYDRDWLYINVVSATSKSFFFRYVSPTKFNEKTGKAMIRDMGLGSFPSHRTLAKARAEAQRLRKLVISGIDPMDQRKADKHEKIAAAKSARTFGECANAYIESQKHGWTNPAHKAQWHSTFNETKRGKKVFPALTADLNDLPVRKVDTAAVESCLKKIWYTKTESAKRARGRIEKVLDWAKVKDSRSGENPARWLGHLDTLLPPPSKVRKPKHQPSLHHRSIFDFMQKLRTRSGVSARALEFLILTVTRTGAVIYATWDEIDFEQRMWTVQSRRIGAKIADDEARVTILIDRAIEILKALPREEGNPYLFIGGKKGRGLSSAAMLELMREIEPDGNGKSKYVPHGFRSTFRTWCSDKTNHPTAVSEATLWHGLPSKLLAAYDRSEMIEKRTRIMNEWAAYCELPPIETDGNVTPIRKVRETA